MPELTEKKDAPKNDNPIVGSAWQNEFERDGVKKTMIKIRLSNKFESLKLTDKDEMVLWPNDNKSKDTSPDYMVKVSEIQVQEK